MTLSTRIMILIVLLGSTAAAGTRTAPDVVDARGDTTHELTGRPVDSPTHDLLGVWLVETDAWFEIHVRVASLGPAKPGVADDWQVTFSTKGRDWFVDMMRSVDGASGDMRVPSLGGSGPSTFDGTASVTFTSDEVIFRATRAFTLTTGGGDETIAFDRGTTLSQIRARSFEGSGTSTGGVLFIRYDAAGTGSYIFQTPSWPAECDLKPDEDADEECNE